jgi:hypothetical protein
MSDLQYTTMNIMSMGPSTLEKPQPRVYATKNTMDISDIDGARAKVRYNFTNKPPLLQSDVPGSTSKVLIHGKNSRDNQLYIDDIEGTRHSVKDRMLRSGRHVDPLMPNYKLPSYSEGQYPVGKFIKEQLNHDDIEGSHVKSIAQRATRDNISVDDIVGAQANYRPLHA